MTDDQRKSVDPAESSGTPESSEGAAEAARGADSADTAAERVRAARPVRRTAQPTGDTRKGRRTPKQKVATGEDESSRVGPVTFTKQSVAELRKVIWPTADQMSRYFAVVLVFVLFIVAYVGALDLVFGWGLLKLLGK